MDTQYSVYFGQEQKNGYTGFLAEKKFFCVAEIFDGYTQEKGEQLMSTLAHLFEFDAPQNLTSFDTTISEVIKKANVPLDTSLAVGYISDTILYLKTVGSGQIALKRGTAFETIIKGTQIASGRISSGDVYIFTTTFFSEVLKGFQHIKSVLAKHTIDSFPDRVKEYFGSQDDTGAIALFVQMKNAPIQEKSSPRSFSFTPPPFLKNRKFLFIPFLLLCVGILGWNVFQSTQKTGIQLQGRTRVEELKQSIQRSIESAENQKDTLSEAVQTLQSAQVAVRDLKQIAQKGNLESVQQLETQLQDKWNKIVGKEQRETKNYFDLTVEEKTARGIRTNLFDGILSILNPDGKVYLLNLNKKSLTQRIIGKKVSQESRVGLYEGTAYVFNPGEGVLTIGENNKVVKSISQDPLWQTIVGLHVYNGNIYLLDGGEGTIYKYLGTGTQFGDRSSYFKGRYDLIDERSSFAINTAVYVATKNSISEYISGEKKEKMFFIPGVYEITKLITYKDEEYIYAWDKKNGVLYVLNTDGVYQKQIANDFFKKANDVEVYKQKAYLLSGQTILVVSIE